MKFFCWIVTLLPMNASKHENQVNTCKHDNKIEQGTAKYRE